MTQYSTLKFNCKNCGQIALFSGNLEKEIDNIIIYCKICERDLKGELKEAFNDFKEYIALYSIIGCRSNDKKVIDAVNKMYDLYLKKIIV